MTKKHVILFLVIILVVALLAETAGYFVGRHQTQDTEQNIEDDYLQWLVIYFEQPCSSFEFDLNNPLSDEALLRYISYSGCYHPQRKWIRQEMIPFYSNTPFSVPCEMVETDITEHFGVGSVSYTHLYGGLQPEVRRGRVEACRTAKCGNRAIHRSERGHWRICHLY